MAGGGMNTGELLARLQRHYIKPGELLPGGVFLPEVGWNGGGYRRCDAIYVGFTSSSGRILVGHELKVSRADWLHKLDHSDKADQWADECHEWWLVVDDPAIVRDGELPAGWGLMAPGRSKTRMEIRQKPDRKPATNHRPSWNAVRSIMARQDTLRVQAISDQKMSARDEAQKSLNARVELEVGRRVQYQPDVEKLQRQLKLIEEALGGEIDWAAEERGYIRADPRYVGLAELSEIADAVRAHGGLKNAVRALTDGYLNPVKNARQGLDNLDKALKAIARAGGAR